MLPSRSLLRPQIHTHTHTFTYIYIYIPKYDRTFVARSCPFWPGLLTLPFHPFFGWTAPRLPTTSHGSQAESFMLTWLCKPILVSPVPSPDKFLPYWEDPLLRRQGSIYPTAYFFLFLFYPAQGPFTRTLSALCALDRCQPY